MSGFVDELLSSLRYFYKIAWRTRRYKDIVEAYKNLSDDDMVYCFTFDANADPLSLKLRNREAYRRATTRFIDQHDCGHPSTWDQQTIMMFDIQYPGIRRLHK